MRSFPTQIYLQKGDHSISGEFDHFWNETICDPVVYKTMHLPSSLSSLVLPSLPTFNSHSSIILCVCVCVCVCLHPVHCLNPWVSPALTSILCSAINLAQAPYQPPQMPMHGVMALGRPPLRPTTPPPARSLGLMARKESVCDSRSTTTPYLHQPDISQRAAIH